ncbi:hypothetical protein M1615_03350 [Patescibacteria group bacterium]|nr:hypothetical protein [Patescibacteria group bacterium]
MKITTISSINNNTSKIDNSRFDISKFPKSNDLINVLNQMFLEQTYENKTVLEAKRILGEKYSFEDARSLIAAFGYLIDDWLEEYERKVFNNKTVKELIHSF